jgi:MFS superfamily sulfate permease-like transporter
MGVMYWIVVALTFIVGMIVGVFLTLVWIFRSMIRASVHPRTQDVEELLRRMEKEAKEE